MLTVDRFQSYIMMLSVVRIDPFSIVPMIVFRSISIHICLFSSHPDATKLCQIFERYCGTEKKPFTIDHVLPKSRNGVWEWENLVRNSRSCVRSITCSNAFGQMHLSVVSIQEWICIRGYWIHEFMNISEIIIFGYINHRHMAVISTSDWASSKK